MRTTKKHPPVFKDKKLQLLLDAIERRNYDGIDKSWVHRVMLAQLKHYNAAKRLTSKKIAGRKKDKLFLKRYRAFLEEGQSFS